MAFGQKQQGGSPFSQPGTTIRLWQQQAQGGAGSDLAAGETYFAGVDSKSGDSFAVFRDPKGPGACVRRVCRVTGAKLSEVVFSPAGAVGWGVTPAVSDEQNAPTAFIGPSGWTFSLVSLTEARLTLPTRGAF